MIYHLTLADPLRGISFYSAAGAETGAVKGVVHFRDRRCILPPHCEYPRLAARTRPASCQRLPPRANARPWRARARCQGRGYVRRSFPPRLHPHESDLPHINCELRTRRSIPQPLHTHSQSTSPLEQDPARSITPHNPSVVPIRALDFLLLASARRQPHDRVLPLRRSSPTTTHCFPQSQ